MRLNGYGLFADSMTGMLRFDESGNKPCEEKDT